MFEQIVGNKKYTLSRVEYRVVEGLESLYLEVDVVEDLEFGTRTHRYGTSFSSDEVVFFLSQIEGMKDYVLAKLIAADA